MTDTTLAGLAGVLLSLAFSYIPGLKEKYAAQTGEAKRLIMLGALLVVAVGVFALSCVKWYDAVTCDVAGAKVLIGLFISSAIANQAAFMLTPPPAKKQAVIISTGGG